VGEVLFGMEKSMLYIYLHGALYWGIAEAFRLVTGVWRLFHFEYYKCMCSLNLVFLRLNLTMYPRMVDHW
jgi:hypothetical protein